MHSLRDRLDSYQPAYDQTGQTLNSAAWGRVYGNRRTRMAMGETLRSQMNARALQVGMDLFGQSSEARGGLRAGLMFSSGHASGRYASAAGKGNKSFQRSRRLRRRGLFCYVVSKSGKQAATPAAAPAQLVLNGEERRRFSRRKIRFPRVVCLARSGLRDSAARNRNRKMVFEPSAQLIYTDYTAHAYQRPGGTRSRLKTAAS